MFVEIVERIIFRLLKLDDLAVAEEPRKALLQQRDQK